MPDPRQQRPLAEIGDSFGHCLQRLCADRDHPVLLPGDEQCRLLDGLRIVGRELPGEIVVPVVIEWPPHARTLKLCRVEIEIGFRQPVR